MNVIASNIYFMLRGGDYFALNLPTDLFEVSRESLLSHIDVGSGVDIAFFELAQEIAEITSFKVRILTETTKLEEAPKKLLNVNHFLKMGGQARISLDEGIKQTYRLFLNNQTLFVHEVA